MEKNFSIESNSDNLSAKVFIHSKNLFAKLINKILKTEYTIFTLLAIITGAVVGFATVLFHDAIDFFNEIFFEQTASGLFFLGAAAVIALPSIGMLIQSLMIKFAPDISKQRGVAEVIKAVAKKGGRIPLRSTIFHFIAPVLSIGSGNTVGPEAPAAQLGGGLANKFAHLFNLSDSRKRVFTAAGSGAAIAAIFNTPLGGIFFALEIILLNEFQATTFSALILATVTSSAISRIFLGNKSIFIFSSPQVGAYYNLYLYLILGLIAGIISILFIRYSYSLDSIFKKRFLQKLPQWLKMTFVGFLMGLCGYFYKDIFGIGYNGINHILASLITWKVVAILFVLKFFLVPLILNSGGFGGIFAPSLFMGACIGFLYATGLNYFFGFQFDTTAFVLVSMGAMLGGINSIPISSILIIFEMTKDYSFILPLMLAVVASTMIVQIVLKKSIHEQHLEHQGYRIAQRKEANLLQSVFVENVLIKDIVLIPEETPLPKVINALMESSHSTFYTIDVNGKILGTITESEIRPIITEYEHIREVLVANDIASKNVTTVKENDDLDYVMKLFEKKDADEFPVISSHDSEKILGAIRRQDVIAAYNKESLKQNIAEGFARELKNVEQVKSIKVLDGFSIVEKNPKREFIGKTIAELNFRNKYGIQILMIKKTISAYSEKEEETDYVVPTASYSITEHDKLILFGEEENINEISNW